MPKSIRTSRPIGTPSIFHKARLDLQKALANGGIGSERSRSAGPDHMPFFDHDMPGYKAQQCFEMFIHDQKGLTFLLEKRQTLPDFGTDFGSQTFGGLVKDQQFQIGR